MPVVNAAKCGQSSLFFEAKRIQLDDCDHLHSASAESAKCRLNFKLGECSRVNFSKSEQTEKMVPESLHRARYENGFHIQTMLLKNNFRLPARLSIFIKDAQSWLEYSRFFDLGFFNPFNPFNPICLGRKRKQPRRAGLLSIKKSNVGLMDSCKFYG